ncbi:MAG: LuxR C-terminal-related transcriptional regulator, partial [Thermodesulfobacteriota bacterium]
AYSARLTVALCVIYLNEGDLKNMLQAAKKCLKFGEKFNMREPMLYGRYYSGIYYYLINEPVTAEPFLSDIVKEPTLTRPCCLASAAFTLALSYAARGLVDKVSKVIEDLVEYSMESKNALLIQLCNEFSAEIMLRQGLGGEAERLIENIQADGACFTHGFYLPRLTADKMMIAGETAADLDRAAARLGSLNKKSAKLHRKFFLIDVLLLEALLYGARGEEILAFDKLRKALDMAKESGFIRLFLDLGAPMEDLLKRLNAKEAANDYIDLLLAAFSTESKIIAPDTASYGAALNQSSESQATDVEFLSKREFETLVLLGQGLSNKEIASRLFISSETVKKHLYNIYQKFHVNNRVSALGKAKVMGLLPSE